MSALMLWAALIAAPEVPVVAVFQIYDSASLLEKEELGPMTDYFAASLAQSGRFKIVPRSEVRGALRRLKVESYKQCYEERCQIELGKEVAAQKAINTKVLPVGTRCAITATLLDLARTTSDKAVTRKVDCDADSVVGALEGIAADLAASTLPKLRIASAPSGDDLKAFNPAEASGRTATPASATTRALPSPRAQNRAPTPPGTTSPGTTSPNAGTTTPASEARSDHRERRPAGGLVPPITGQSGKSGTLVINSLPLGAKVKVDGEDMGVTPVVLTNQSQRARRVRVEKEGHLPYETWAQVGGSRNTQLTSALIPLVKHEAQRSRYRTFTAWGWTSFTAALLSAVGAGTLFILRPSESSIRSNEYDAFLNARTLDGQQTNYAELESRVRRHNMLNIGGIVLGVATAVFGSVSMGLLFGRDEPEESSGQFADMREGGLR